MIAVLDTLPTASQAASSLFSSTCLSHCVTDGAEFWSITVQKNGVNTSMASMMADWWFGNNVPRVISTCVGWECMAQCVPMERKFPQGFGATETVATDGDNLGASSDGQNDGATPVPPSEMTPTEASDTSTDSAAGLTPQTPAPQQQQQATQAPASAPQQQQQQAKPAPAPAPAPQ